MKTITVEVTREDGQRGGCHGDNCAVWRAIKRQIADHYRVGVGIAGGEIWTEGAGIFAAFELPPIARRYIVDRDAGTPVSPFTFPLDLPDWVELREPVAA